MNLRAIIYWSTTIGVCAIISYSAYMYLTNTEGIQQYYEHLSYPSYLVIPLAIAKICAVIMILWNKSQWLTEWAYAGLFFDMVLAFTAHQVTDGEGGTLALIGLACLVASYFFRKEVRKT